MDRRTFITLGGWAGASTFSLHTAGLDTLAWLSPLSSLIKADIVVIGGGVGGCAAALAAAKAGMRVIMTEETDWIGGQLTQQSVPPDEHGWVEKFGVTDSYRAFRDGVREYYRQWYPLTGASYRNDRFNPGACTVSRLCHEPRVALAVLHGMMAPHISAGRLQILHNTIPIAAHVQNDAVKTVEVLHGPSGARYELEGAYFIDGTELGDLLPLTGAEYVTGAESQTDTGEAQPQNMQSMTWCFAIDYAPGEDHTIEKPENYEHWRSYVPALTPAWTGELLSFTNTHPITLEPRTFNFDPRPGIQMEGFNLWTYRRLIAPHQFEAGAIASDICLVNWPQNDYMAGNIIDVSAEEAERHKKGAMEVSFALLYWLQTEAPRLDGKAGWPGLRLRHDVVDTTHGLAKRPYIRESRRIKALFTVKEQHVGQEARMQETGLPADEVRASTFEDSVGIGSYRIDLHPSTGGDNYIDIPSLPFEIPLGALIPQRIKNLMPACKNLGVTHITNGCYRLHPVEWNIGEAAGLTAAYCVKQGNPPAYIRSSPAEFANLGRLMDQMGIERHWPR